MNAGLSVEEDPDLGHGIELELLDDELVSSRGAEPMDAIERIAGDVLADAGGIGGGLVGAEPQRLPAGQQTRGTGEGVHIDHHGVDQEGSLGSHLPADGEQSKKITRDDLGGPEGEDTALYEAGPSAVRAALTAPNQGEHPRSLRSREVGPIPNLQPEPGETCVVLDPETLLKDLPHVGPPGPRSTLQRHTAERQLRPGPAHGHQGSPEIAEASVDGQPGQRQTEQAKGQQDQHRTERRGHNTSQPDYTG